MSPLLAGMPLSFFHPLWPVSLGERVWDMPGMAALPPAGRSGMGTARRSSRSRISLRSVSRMSARAGGGGSARRTVSKLLGKRSKPELSLWAAGRDFLASGSASKRLRLGGNEGSRLKGMGGAFCKTSNFGYPIQNIVPLSVPKALHKHHDHYQHLLVQTEAYSNKIHITFYLISEPKTNHTATYSLII